MAEQPEIKTVNQVDTVLQDYLDQMLVIGTAPAGPPETPVSVIPQTPPSVAVEVQPVTAVAEAIPARQEASPRPTSPEPVSRTQVAEPLPQTLVMPEVAIEVVEEIAEPEVQVAEPVADENLAAPQADSVNKLSVSAGGSTPVDPMALDWSTSQGIDCLIFKVAGLKLAIPLPLLGGVFNVTDKVTPLFGQAAWSLGVWQGETGKLTIIDSAQLIMPERGLSLADSGYSFFIQLDRSPWALACQEICDTVTLVHDSIKWRGETSKRPWLAGTVISEMCALVDVPGLMSLLSDNIRPGVSH